MENVITFAQLSYILSGAKLVIRYMHGGDFGEELYRGTIEALHEPENRELHNRIDAMEATFIDAEDGELMVGVLDYDNTAT